MTVIDYNSLNNIENHEPYGQKQINGEADEEWDFYGFKVSPYKMIINCKREK